MYQSVSAAESSLGLLSLFALHYHSHPRRVSSRDDRVSLTNERKNPVVFGSTSVSCGGTISVIQRPIFYFLKTCCYLS